MSELASNWWRGKRVLITGHTGFKGAWLSIWLEKLGARVFGLSLAPISVDDLFLSAGVSDLCEQSFIGNILDPLLLQRVVGLSQPDVIFHMAAQPLVRESYRSPKETFETNVMGTVNLLEAIRGLNKSAAVVVVTTDKVYANFGDGIPFVESDRLGGSDPYSASKAGAELVVDCYRDSFFREGGNIRVASARAGNVIGGGDWSADRLIPDCFRAVRAGNAVTIRNPSFTRPWQHVLDPLEGYMSLAKMLYSGRQIGASYNFGPPAYEEATVQMVLDMILKRVPTLTQEVASEIGQPKEASLLALNTERAKREIGVTSRWNLQESVTRTADWYVAFLSGEKAYDLCERDLSVFGLH